MTQGDAIAKTLGMGMDGVELVMAVEEAFDIRIDDAEAERILTPRQLIELVQAKVANVETSICLTHRAFNLVRRFILQRFPIPRAAIIPTTPLASIVPQDGRKLFLHALSAELNTFKPPQLAVPRWFSRAFPASIFCGGIAGGWIAFKYVGSVAVAGGFFGGAVGCLLLGLVFIKPFATEFPKSLSTIGDLALWVRTYKRDLADKSQRTWTREQIAAQVRDITIDVLSCEKNYREEARFVQDLGLS